MDTGDNELIKCVKEGDLKAFEKVFKDYYALMCSVAMDYVNDSAMCQTLTEDVLLNLWEKKNELVITTSLRAYLLRAVRNKCIDHLRTQRQNSDFLGYYDSQKYHSFSGNQAYRHKKRSNALLQPLLTLNLIL